MVVRPVDQLKHVKMSEILHHQPKSCAHSFALEPVFASKITLEMTTDIVFQRLAVMTRNNKALKNGYINVFKAILPIILHNKIKA
jgi:hypothetical protein